MRSLGVVTLALAAGFAAALASAPAHAGGAIGWANAVTQFSTEGQAVGAAAVILGIIAIGAVLFFGLSGLVGTVIMACLGGALMANSQAMNTGHDGTLCTLHSNGAGEALRRLHTLVAEAQPSFPFGGVLSAVDHVLQLEGRGERRRLAEVWPVPRGGDGKEYGR